MRTTIEIKRNIMGIVRSKGFQTGGFGWVARQEDGGVLARSERYYTSPEGAKAAAKRLMKRLAGDVVFV